MTLNTWVSARICGSHICRVQPSEFDSIKVGPPSRPSTVTLTRQPSASIIGISLVLLASVARFSGFADLQQLTFIRTSSYLIALAGTGFRRAMPAGAAAPAGGRRPAGGRAAAGGGGPK